MFSIQGWIGNIRLSNSGSRLLLTPFGAPHPRGRVAVYGPRCNCARRSAPLLPLARVCVRGTPPLLRGDPGYRPRSPPFLDRPGSPPPSSLRSSPARRLYIWGTFGYGICCGCLRYDTGPVSAALHPREPASLLCAIKRLSLLGGWMNYLPDFQLRVPYSRFVDSSQHLIQIFIMLTCLSVDKLF